MAMIFTIFAVLSGFPCGTSEFCPVNRRTLRSIRTILSCRVQPAYPYSYLAISWCEGGWAVSMVSGPTHPRIMKLPQSTTVDPLLVYSVYSDTDVFTFLTTCTTGVTCTDDSVCCVAPRHLSSILPISPSHTNITDTLVMSIIRAISTRYSMPNWMCNQNNSARKNIQLLEMKYIT